MVTIVHRHIPAAPQPLGNTADGHFSVSVSGDATTSPASPPEAELLPLHSWTYVHPTSRDACVVTLHARRLLRLSDGARDVGQGNDSPTSLRGSGYCWELLHVPSEEAEMQMSHAPTLPPPMHTSQSQRRVARSQFIFASGCLADLVVASSQGVSDVEDAVYGGGAAGAAVPTTSAAGTSHGAARPSTLDTLVARDLVVFLSDREVMVYTGKTNTGDVSLDYFFLTEEESEAEAEAGMGIASPGVSWQRRAAAVPLTPVSDRDGEAHTELLLLSPVKTNNQESTHLPSVRMAFLISSGMPSKGGDGRVSITAGTLTLVGGSADHTLKVTCGPVFTDSEVYFSSLLGVPCSVPGAPHALFRLQPQHCHWVLLNGNRIVGLLPWVKTKTKSRAPRGDDGAPAEGEDDRTKKHAVVMVGYGIPRMIGSCDANDDKTRDTSAVFTVHRQQTYAVPAANESGDDDDDTQELLDADADELVERLTTEQMRLYCAPLQAGASVKRNVSAQTVAEAPAAVQFRFAGLDAESSAYSQKEDAAGLCIALPSPWSVMLEKRKREAAAGIRSLSVPQRRTVWAAGRPLSLVDAGDGASPLASSSAGAFETIPTTAASAGAGRRETLCFPSTHVVSKELRLSYVLVPDKAGGEAQHSLLCAQPTGDSTSLTDLDAVPELVESLLSSTLAAFFAEHSTRSVGENAAPFLDTTAHAELVVERVLAELWRRACLQGRGLVPVLKAVERLGLPSPSSLPTTTERQSSSASRAPSFAAYARQVWASITERDAQESAVAARFFFTAVKEMLVQLDWRLAEGSPSACTALDDVYSAAARFFLAGTGPVHQDKDSLSPRVRCSALVAFHVVLEDQHPRGKSPFCGHWLRRVLLRHLCRQRHGNPLELLVEDIFTTASAASAASQGPHGGPVKTDRFGAEGTSGSGMEMALLQITDDAALLANLGRLTPHASSSSSSVGEPGVNRGEGFLFLSDLCLVYGARTCACTPANAQASKEATHGRIVTLESGSIGELFHNAAAFASSSVSSLSLGFVPLLLDVAATVAETTVAVGDRDGACSADATACLVSEVMQRWQRIVAEEDGEETTLVRPIAVPACLRRGPAWRELTVAPWSVLPANVLWSVLGCCTDSLTAWQRHHQTHRTMSSQTVEGAAADNEDDTPDAWSVYFEECGSDLAQLRGAAHVLLWLSGGNTSVTTDLVHAMHSIAAPEDPTTASTTATPTRAAAVLSDWNVLLTDTSTAHLLGEEGNYQGEGHGPAGPAARVARCLHRCLAHSTGQLLRRLVRVPSKSSSLSHLVLSAQEQTLAQMYLSQAGAEAAMVTPPPVSPGASSGSLSRSLHRRFTPPHTSPEHATEDGTAEAPPCIPPSQPQPEKDFGVTAAPPLPTAAVTEALGRLAVAAWTLPFQHDAEAVTNAALAEKLLDAFLWLDQQQHQQQTSRPSRTSSGDGATTQGPHERIGEKLFAFLRVFFLRVYPLQLRLVEAELRMTGGHASLSSMTSHQRHRGAVVDTAAVTMHYAQIDSIGSSSRARTMGAGELTEATRRTLSRLLETFRDSCLPMRCLAALFSVIPSPADTAERVVAEVKRQRSLHGALKRHPRQRRRNVMNSADAPSDLGSEAQDEEEEEEEEQEEANLSNDSDDADDHDGIGVLVGGTRRVGRGSDEDAVAPPSTWFSLSLPTAYFVAGQIGGHDLGRFVLAGELLRRELRAYTMAALFSRNCFFFDRKRGTLCGRQFDCRQLINDLADECDLCSRALAACAPLYEPLLVLLLLDVVEEQVVADGKSREDVVEGNEQDERDAEGCSMYPAETVASMRQCIGKAAQKVYKPLHADERVRVVRLLRVDFRPYLEADGAAALTDASLDYELSPIHQRICRQVRPQICATTEALCRGTAQALNERTRKEREASSLSLLSTANTAVAATPIDPFARERAAAAAVVGGLSAGLRSAFGAPPSTQLPSTAAPLNSHPSPLTSSQPPAAPEGTATPSMALQLVVREETARRKPLEAALQSEYSAFFSSAAVEAALATVYLALRYEARRRDLIRFVDEQHDILETFELLYRRKLSAARERDGHKAERAAALRRAEAFENLWRAEDEDRLAIEAECYASKNAMWALASEQESCMAEESQTRAEWELIEQEARAELLQRMAEDRTESLNRQADREEEEEWARMEQEAPTPVAKNAFQLWQEKTLQQVREPEDAPAARPPPPTHHTLSAPPQPPPLQQPPHPHPTPSTEPADPIAAGLSQLVGAGEGLFGAFSALQSKLRDTVAPPPRPQQPQQQPEAWQRTAEAAQPAPEKEDWGWEDDDGGFEEVPLAPATKAPLSQAAAAAPVTKADPIDDKDGWGWSEDDDEDDATGGKEGAVHAVPTTSAPPAEIPVVPLTNATTHHGGKKKGKGLGMVEAIGQGPTNVAPPAGPPPPSAPAAAADSWGWDDDDNEDDKKENNAVEPQTHAAAAQGKENALQSEIPEKEEAPKEVGLQSLGPNLHKEKKKKKHGLLAAVPIEEPMEGTTDTATTPLAEASANEEAEEVVPSPATTFPETPDPSRNIYNDIAEAEEGENREHDAERPADEPTDAVSDHLEAAPDHPEMGWDEDVEVDPFLLDAMHDLEDEEETARQMLMVEEVCLYQHFKRSLILSYV